MSFNSQTVCKTNVMCKDLHISFPVINVTNEDITAPKAFYVFKGLKNTPTVIHIPLFNVENCGRLRLSIHKTCCTHAVQFIKKDVIIFYRAVYHKYITYKWHRTFSDLINYCNCPCFQGASWVTTGRSIARSSQLTAQRWSRS